MRNTYIKKKTWWGGRVRERERTTQTDSSQHENDLLVYVINRKEINEIVIL